MYVYNYRIVYKDGTIRFIEAETAKEALTLAGKGALAARLSDPNEMPPSQFLVPVGVGV